MDSFHPSSVLASTKVRLLLPKCHDSSRSRQVPIRIFADSHFFCTGAGRATITRKYGGTGLGLAICQQLVELMGGKIGVYREPQRGSQFWFLLSLPVADDEMPRMPAAPERGHRVAPGARILLVEDHETNQRVARRMLEKLGCQVEIAATGNEAVKMVRLQCFDLVLMDCDLPGMNGFEATQWIRAEEAAGQHIPIVALTAHAMTEDLNQCLRAGMDDYLAKPVEMANMARALNQWAVLASHPHPAAFGSVGH
jgi:CheY-like chemotaxis protein